MLEKAASTAPAALVAVVIGISTRLAARLTEDEVLGHSIRIQSGPQAAPVALAHRASCERMTWP